MNDISVNLYEKINHSLLRGMHSIFEASAERANNKIGDTPDQKHFSSVPSDGGYKCIHLSPESFCIALAGVLKHLKVSEVFRFKFLDIGSGVGEKVYLANLFGLNAFGLELRKPLITEGRRLLKNLGVRDIYGSLLSSKRLIQGNALTFNYKDFDFLYFYCPLRDHELQIKLERQIAETAKIGAVVLPFLSHGAFSDDPKHQVRGWKKIQTGDTRYFIREA